MSKKLLSSVKAGILLVVFSFVSNSMLAQTDLLATAGNLFEKGSYYSAAILYEKYLSKEKVKPKQNSFKPYFIHQKETAPRPEKIAAARAAWNLAECYRLINNYKSAQKWYGLCIDDYRSIFPLGLYWYGVCLRANNDYTAAEQFLRTFITTYNVEDAYKNDALNEIKNLEFIHNQFGSNYNNLYDIKKIVHPINQEAGWFAATIGNDGFLFFTSTQTDSSAMRKNENPYKNRIFMASLKNETPEEAKLLFIDGTDDLNDQGTASFYPSGEKMFFTQWQKKDGKTNAEIYSSIKINGHWSNPQKADRINLVGYNSMQPFVSSDGKYIFFSSDRPGGYGKYDLWYAAMKDNVVISDPINLGKQINSPESEEAPFYSVLKNTLVFSANGRIGYGGFDFFKVKGMADTWEEPVNMGYPFNSSRDDIYFFSRENGNTDPEIYFSSDRESSCCLELYKAKKINQVKMFTGIVVDCKTNMPLADGKIYVSDIQNRHILDSSLTNLSGKYIFNLGENDSLDLTVSKPGYENRSVRIVSEYDSISSMAEFDTLMIRDVCLESLHGDNSVQDEKDVIVYFDFDKYGIDSLSKEKLSKVLIKLKSNPAWVVEIGGYTDEKGSDKYNLNLGYKRARSAAEYLLNAGIPANRLRLKSYGKCCPVDAKNLNSDGLSRKVQFLFFTGSD